MPEPDASLVVPKTILSFFGFLVFTAFAGTLLCALWLNLLPVRSALQAGIETQAILHEKYVDEDGNYHFRYYFETANGNIYQSSIEVNQASYQAYESGVILPMRYLATNPDSNVLILLENDIQASYRFLLILSLLVIVIAGGLASGWIGTIINNVTKH